jgi:hypothetical protein
MDELICLSWMKYLQAKDFFLKPQKHIIYMEIQNLNLKNNCNPLVVVYNL